MDNCKGDTETKYRMLNTKDIIAFGDEFLGDDCTTWIELKSGKIESCYAGMKYKHGVLKPIRRLKEVK